MTEGVGCYDYSIIDPSKKLEYREIGPEHYPRFHEFGWPNRVGKKLGFDKVLNLGAGGSSNSAHLKIFLGIIPPIFDDLKTKYDIFLIWMMTDPLRMSYAAEDKIMNINPKFMRNDVETGLMKDIVRYKLVPEKEQVYNMMYGEFIFRSLNIDYLFTSWSKNFPEIYRLFESNNYLSPEPDLIPNSSLPEHRSKICKHPNEVGYELMANLIVERINKYHSRFVMGPPREIIEWEHKKYCPTFDPAVKSYFSI